MEIRSAIDGLHQPKKIELNAWAVSETRSADHDLQAGAAKLSGSLLHFYLRCRIEVLGDERSVLFDTLACLFGVNMYAGGNDDSADTVPLRRLQQVGRSADIDVSRQLPFRGAIEVCVRYSGKVENDLRAASQLVER